MYTVDRNLIESPTKVIEYSVKVVNPKESNWVFVLRKMDMLFETVDEAMAACDRLAQTNGGRVSDKIIGE